MHRSRRSRTRLQITINNDQGYGSHGMRISEMEVQDAILEAAYEE